MKFNLALLGLLAGAQLATASDPANTVEVFSHTAVSYKKLKTYQVEAETHIALAKNGVVRAYQYTTTLAADEQGRSYVENRSPQGTELRISDGSTTWKYASARNAWSKDQLAQASGLDDGESPDASTPQDLFSQMARTMIARYTVLQKYAAAATYIKDDKIKLNGVKQQCHVYRVIGKQGISNELWIAEESGWIVRHVEKSTGGEVTTDYKQISTSQPEASLFDFQPPHGAKQVANLLLPSEREVSLVGTAAMDFALKALTGEQVRLSDLHGKVVLLDFWASWCAPCRHELPTIAKLNQKLQGTNVVVLGINDEDASTAKHFLESSKMDLMTLHDGERKVAKGYSCYAIPTVIIIDPTGKIAAHYVGERDESTFMASLKEAGMK